MVRMAFYYTFTCVSAGLAFCVGMFLGCLLVNQLNLIRRNLSYVDKLQKRKSNHEVEL